MSTGQIGWRDRFHSRQDLAHRFGARDDAFEPIVLDKFFRAGGLLRCVVSREDSLGGTIDQRTKQPFIKCVSCLPSPGWRCVRLGYGSGRGI